MTRRVAGAVVAAAGGAVDVPVGGDVDVVAAVAEDASGAVEAPKEHRAVPFSGTTAATHANPTATSPSANAKVARTVEATTIE